jgi:exonuclease III
MADFVIGSFNCRWGCLNDNEKKEFRNESRNVTIREFVKWGHLDILTLQEYRTSENPLYEKNSSPKRFDILHPEWMIDGFSSRKRKGVDFSYERTKEYCIPARYSYVDNGYAIMWNCNKFEILSSDKELEEKFNGIRSNYLISRPPQILRLKYKMGNGKGCEIRIINTHLTFSGKEAKTIYIKENEHYRIRNITSDMRYVEKKPQPIIKRQEELVKCLEMYKKVASMIAKDTPPSLHTILLGDFNLTPDECNNILKNTSVVLPNYSDQKKLSLKQEELTTLKRKMILGNKVYFNKSYDHFIINPALTAESSVINTVCKYFKERNDVHYLQFSDHIPIKLEVTLP